MLKQSCIDCSKTRGLRRYTCINFICETPGLLISWNFQANQNNINPHDALAPNFTQIIMAIYLS